jgi:hypothetical protein
MAWNLGLLGAASFVAPTGNYDLLQTEILTGSQASVTFSSLGDYATDYQHLQLRISARGNRATFAQDTLRIYLNGDTTLSNYNVHDLTGGGSAVSSGYSANQNFFIRVDGSQSATNAFGAAIVDFLDPFESGVKNKTVRALSGHSSPDAGGASGKHIMLSSLLWRNTNALTSIRIDSLDSVLVANSRFSLYGLRK